MMRGDAPWAGWWRLHQRSHLTEEELGHQGGSEYDRPRLKKVKYLYLVHSHIPLFQANPCSNPISSLPPALCRLVQDTMWRSDRLCTYESDGASSSTLIRSALYHQIRFLPNCLHGPFQRLMFLVPARWRSVPC